MIAVLDSHDRLQNAVLEARQQVRVAQSRLAQIRAGAKTGEIAARRAEILRFQADLQGEQVTRIAKCVLWMCDPPSWMSNARWRPSNAAKRN